MNLNVDILTDAGLFCHAQSEAEIRIMKKKGSVKEPLMLSKEQERTKGCPRAAERNRTVKRFS